MKVRNKNRSESELSNFLYVKAYRRKSVTVAAKRILKNRIKDYFGIVLFENVASVQDTRNLQATLLSSRGIRHSSSHGRL